MICDPAKPTPVWRSFFVKHTKFDQFLELGVAGTEDERW